MIDTVILDLGNVLLEWDAALAHPDLSREEHARICQEIGFADLNLRADAGESWAALEAEVATRHPRRAGFLAQYVAGFPASIQSPVAGMPELVAELRALGLRLIGLTNFSAETYPVAPRVSPTVASLEAVVVSGEVGLIKPDPRIYRHLMREHRVRPARSVFVDDRPENVFAAEALGMRGVVFTSAQALRVELRAWGIEVAAG
ncbi:HAD family hydrolase [Serinibacter salmoneus]|uniref:2-haloacid dehalogenase n=1 Tax=Serinibacter salmoneus TaxID=556530 RepID=A0A2A9CZ22_9MICO|nr:HAD family phosphatase [Serinibacter salmoneus]PFG19653.1 2-haloacid dehalogenase [Serinibacter salmoneus]